MKTEAKTEERNRPKRFTVRILATKRITTARSRSPTTVNLLVRCKTIGKGVSEAEITSISSTMRLWDRIRPPAAYCS